MIRKQSLHHYSRGVGGRMSIPLWKVVSIIPFVTKVFDWYLKCDTDSCQRESWSLEVVKDLLVLVGF
jgi:hypothetical protein